MMMMMMMKIFKNALQALIKRFSTTVVFFLSAHAITQLLTF